MHRIDDPTAVPTLPAPRPPGTPGYFTGGSPGSSGFAATVVRYEWMNAVQEELCAVIAEAGITLDKTNNNQLVAALQQLMRFRLARDLTLYISPTGNDANDGLTPETALASGQAAWDYALTLDLFNHNLIMQFADGTYTRPMVCAGSPLGTGAAAGVTIQGNLTTPGSVIFAPTGNATCITASNGAAVFVQGVSLTAYGTPTTYQNMGMGLFAAGGGVITFAQVDFGHCDWAHVAAGGSGQITSAGAPYTINGGSGAHVLTYFGGYASVADSAVSLTGNPAFSNAFIYTYQHGVAAVLGMAFSGAATGPRYFAGTGGLIATNGAGPTYLPGSVAGSVDATTYGLYL